MQVNITDTKVKLRWREKYLTDGSNERALAHPRGAYRGFWAAARIVPDTWMRLLIDPAATSVDLDQFAIYGDRAEGFSVSIREDADVEFDCAAMFPAGGIDETWYVYIIADYNPNVATTAHYCVEKVDPLDPASGPLYYPNAVVLATVTVLAGSVDFTGATFVVATRTVPQPTPRRLIGDFVEGDEPWGHLSGIDRWRIPTVDEKEALDAAPTAATGANPVVTVADVAPTTEKIVSQPERQNVVGAGLTYIDLDTTKAYYVGDGIAGTAAYYFDLMTVGTPFPLVGITQRRVSIGVVQKVIGGVPSTLVPGVDADAEGFWPPAVGPGNVLRLNLIYEDGTAATLGGGASTDVWYGVKTMLHDLEDAPAYPMAQGSRRRYGHADDSLVRQYTTPPAITPDNLLATVGDAIRLLQEQGRGPAYPNMSDEAVAAKAAWDSLNPDTYSFSDANITVVAATSISKKMVFCKLLGESRIVTTYTNAGAPSLQVVDLSDMSVADLPVPSATPGFFAGMQITAICSDGPYVYVRMYKSAGNEHYITAFDVFTGAVRPGWPGDGILFGTGTADCPMWTNPPYGIVLPMRTGSGWADDLIVASATTLAANRSWADMTAPGGDGIAIIDKATGAVLSNGSGDEVPTLGAPVYPMGTLASDGTNVYFTYRLGTSIEGGIGQCQIANAALSTTPGWAPQISYALEALPTDWANRGLVYDGRWVWMINGSLGNAGANARVVGCNPMMLDGGGVAMPLDFIGDNDLTSNWWTIGPPAFDGKYIYFGIYGPDGIDSSKSLDHIVRVEPGRMRFLHNTAHTHRITDLITAIWSVRDAIEDPNVNPTIPWGPIAFDGQDLFFFQEDDNAEPWSDKMQRLRLIKFLH